MAKFKRARAHTQYRLADGTRVPGTTTICGQLDKPALVRWANKIGLEGYDVRSYTDPLKGIGTLTHARILAEESGKPLTENLDEYSAKEIDLSDNSMLKYWAWRESRHFEPAIITETPLVSEVYRFGGTPDLYCKIDGLKTLVDYKTGSGIYFESLLQAAAYAQLLEEQGHAVERTLVVNIGRSENERFAEREYSRSELDEGWKLFWLLRQVYDKRKALGG